MLVRFGAFYEDLLFADAFIAPASRGA